MKTLLTKTLVLMFLIQFTLPAAAQHTSGYAPVNGLNLYYEIHGEGTPLVLIHGSYMTIAGWEDLLPELAKKHKVIAFEMQGHGHTADIDRPFSYTSMADDIAKALKYLKIDKADVLGYSFGGTIAFEFAIKNPEMLNRLVIVSSVYKQEGWLPQVRDALKSFTEDIFDNTPMKAAYDKAAPDKGHWHAFVKKMMQFDTVPFDLGAENVQNIKAPVLLLMGDNDGVDLNYTIDTYRLLGGGIFADMEGLPKSQLAIMPGKAHVSLVQDAKGITGVIEGFLNPVKK
jgi:pimeloyl-ACP methyl ester carboxylesterase